MKIAVTYENGLVFGHFGHTEEFKIFDVADGKIINSNVFSTNGSGHGALATFLKGLDVNVLICGGIGAGARTALNNAGIEIFGGVTGSADVAVENFVANTLIFDPDAKCDHHGHGEEGHVCGEHGCGEHECGNH